MNDNDSTFPRDILLIEDNEQDVALTKRALAERGATNVVSVSRGEQGLDYLYGRGSFEDREPGDPSLIILDLGLPDGSGLGVLERIRQDPAKRHIPIVVLTVSEKDADRHASFAAGASIFVQKPVQYQEFMATMRAVGRYWQDQQSRRGASGESSKT